MPNNVRNLVATLSLVAAGALTGCSGSTGTKLNVADPAINYHVVSTTLYRGGRPDQAGVTELASSGVKTIIDLEDDMGVVSDERGWAEALGMKHLSDPMNGEKTPDDNMVNDLLAVLADPAQGPFFVHCQEGVDRTGLVVGLHRVFNESWTPADAYSEMKAMGFKTYLDKLRNYYSVKTGYDAQE